MIPAAVGQRQHNELLDIGVEPSKSPREGADDRWDLRCDLSISENEEGVSRGQAYFAIRLRRESRAWNRQMNRRRTRINWKFDRKAARRKFRYKKKDFKRS